MVRLGRNLVARRSLIATVIAIVGLSGTAHADTFGGTRRDNGDIKCRYDSTVATFATTDYTSYFDLARAQWSDISTKVNVLKTTSTTGYPDKYYVGDNPFGTGEYAYTRYFYVTFGIATEVTDQVDHDITFATVSLYEDAMNDAGLTETNRKATTIHELGHTLKLAHPGAGTERQVALPSGQHAVMEQGPKTWYVQQYDKDDITAKYGP